MSNGHQPPTKLDKTDFLELSSLLTGVGVRTLTQADALIESAEGRNFLDLLIQYVGPEMALGEIVRKYDLLKAEGKTPQQIIEYYLLDNADSQLSQAVRALMKLWYLGVWVQPYDYGIHKKWNPADQPCDGQPPDPGYPPTIDFSMGYSESLAWKVAQAHAVGDSDSSPFPLRFGYWTKAPPPLSEFIG